MTRPAAERQSLCSALLRPVLAAAAAIMTARADGFAVERKADSSPVTEADRRAEAILLAALAKAAPGVPVVAEEEVSAGRLPAGLDGTYFLVDALDGTKEFVGGGKDFTVNLALVEDGVPTMGLVAAPARDTLWFGAAGAGAFLVDPVDPTDMRPIRVRTPPADGIDIVASRSHRDAATDAFIARFPGARVVSIGSSLKFCMLAEGSADLYPRLGPTSQWDIAAGDGVLRAAGGRVLGLDGAPLAYRAGSGEHAARFLNPAFVATAGIEPFG